MGHTNQGGLCTYWGHEDVWTQPVENSHVCICGTVATGVCDDACGLCYFTGSYEICVLNSESCAEPVPPTLALR